MENEMENAEWMEENGEGRIENKEWKKAKWPHGQMAPWTMRHG